MVMWDVVPGPGPIPNGASGASCKVGADSIVPACGADLCCGTAKKDGAETIEICHINTAATYTGRGQIEMTFQCGAERLVALATALLACVYLM